MNYKEVEKEYKLLCDLYGIETSAWETLFTEYYPMVFCIENRKSIISQYLALETFVEFAKKVNFQYSTDIDNFLKEYHNVVYNCLNCTEL